MDTSMVVTRQNGKSNSKVLIEYLKDAKPGEVLTYDQLSDVLSADNRRFERKDVQGAINGSRRAILKSLQRALRPVKNVGYEVARAEEHVLISQQHQEKSRRRMLAALNVLRHARTEELGETARQVHEATLVLVVGLVENQRAMEKRLSAVEEAIERSLKPKG